MLAEPTAAGYAKSALVLAMVCWAWSGYAWATNAIDLGWPLLRLGYLTAMGASRRPAVPVSSSSHRVPLSLGEPSQQPKETNR